MPQNTITLTAADAAFVRDLLGEGSYPDEQVTDYQRALALLTNGSPDDGFPMAARCACNQADEVRVNFHRRGDLRFCRDVFEAGVRA